MKKSFVVLLSALFFSACEKEVEEPAGKWDPMEWEKTTYTKVMDSQNGTYYNVPIEGGEYVFRCKNYKPWLSSLHLYKYDNLMNVKDDQHIIGADIKNSSSYSNDWCSVLSKDGSLIVTFQKNDSLSRGLGIDVTAGDIFGYFTFIQESPAN